MARNRKRAKERRARRPQPTGARRDARDAREDTPAPIAHAAPDVELAEAQLAVGRGDVPTDEDELGYAEPASGAELDESEFDPEPEPVGAGGGGGRVATGAGFDGEIGGGGGAGGAGAGAVSVPGPVAPQARAGILTRLVGFLQGSWRELQRVQWPDRRQVAQATSVVIGFVIVAGVFLGLSDLAFSHLMNYILYGKP